MDDHNEQPSNGSGQEVEEDFHDTTTDDDDSDGSESEESGIDDDQTSYLTELRDELRAELLERQRALEARRTEQ